MEFPLFYGADDGGGLKSYTEEGDGYVSYTKYGEFVTEISDQGGLIAEFPEHGLTFFYDDSGELSLAAMDLDSYLSGLNAEMVKDMPNGGVNIYGMVKFLRDNDLSMVAYMTMKTRNFEVVLMDNEGNSISIQEVEDADFRSGISGKMGIGGFELAFEFTDYGDDVLMSVGETDGENTKLAGVEFSNYVPFEDEMFGDDPQRFNRLAAKIILQ